MDGVFDISKFYTYREDNRLEVKKAEGGLPRSLWDSYSAMANTYGGVIICGVGERKDGSWYTTGMKNRDKLLKDFWNQINDRKKVSINLLKESDVEGFDIDGNTVLVIHVPMADRGIRPVYLNGDLLHGAFKRNNDGDYHCTESEVHAMLRDQPRRTLDTKTLPYAISDLDKESIKVYRRMLELKRPGHVFLSYPDDEFLTHIGAAWRDENGKYKMTCAGLLMFGQEYMIAHEYPDYFLDYREYMIPDIRWSNRIQSQDGDWSGNVFDFFGRVSSKLVLDLNKPFKLVNMQRVDETPMHDAVREALVNCLVNTDFFLPRGVVIERYPEKIILKNPGTIIVGKQQILRGGESEPRNATLMKMFNLIGFGEHAGSGVPDIFAVWKEANYVSPTVEELFGPNQPNRTIVTLPLVEDSHHITHHIGDDIRDEAGDNSNTVDWEARKQLILKTIEKDTHISIVKIASATGLSKRQVEKTIDSLKTDGELARSGSAYTGQWIVLKKQ